MPLSVQKFRTLFSGSPNMASMPGKQAEGVYPSGALGVKQGE